MIAQILMVNESCGLPRFGGLLLDIGPIRRAMTAVNAVNTVITPLIKIEFLI
jgi:hypothetical protein